MWYFIWFIVAFLATALSIITGLWYERRESASELKRDRKEIRTLEKRSQKK